MHGRQFKVHQRLIRLHFVFVAAGKRDVIVSYLLRLCLFYMHQFKSKESNFSALARFFFLLYVRDLKQKKIKKENVADFLS